MLEILAQIGVVVYLVVTFGISVWNAWAAGSSWAMTEMNGGFWRKITLWSAAIMSAIGFTWVYLIVATIILQLWGKVDQEQVGLVFSLGYLIVIAPLLLSGFVITINSWVSWWKDKKSITKGGVAVYNTSAQIYNSWRALEGVSKAATNVAADFAKGGSGQRGKGALTGLAIAAVIIALVLGIITTVLIVRYATSRTASRASKAITFENVKIRDRAGNLYGAVRLRPSKDGEGFYAESLRDPTKNAFVPKATYEAILAGENVIIHMGN